MTQSKSNFSSSSELPGGIPKPKQRVSLVKNVFSNWTSLVLNIVIAFFLTPYVINTIGTRGYGIWVVVLSIVGYYGLLDLGVRSAILRYVALNVGKGDRDELKSRDQHGSCDIHLSGRFPGFFESCPGRVPLCFL